MFNKIVIIGGCGHVGLPLGVKFALAGMQTHLLDIDKALVAKVLSGKFPFVESDGDRQLQAALERGLSAGSDPEICREAQAIVFVTGTPVDEHLNPKISAVREILDSYFEYIRDDTLLVMRSTLFPGTMEHIRKRIQKSGLGVSLAFCPERVAEGHALGEIETLPQIVSAFDEESFQKAYALFAAIAPSVIRLTPIEAELTKLMANAWRYLEFAIGNQFYMIAEHNGLDFHRIFKAIRYEYPRAAGYKAPGFAAGPCLFKDTMQLASYVNHHFSLGHSAMLVNERLASFVVDKAKQKLGGELWGKRVGILGMTFKADNDDIRESLSFKVKKALEFEHASVLCHDPYLSDSPPLHHVLEESDMLILGVPHREYRSLDLQGRIIDVWGIFHTQDLEVLPGKTSLKKVAP